MNLISIQYFPTPYGELIVGSFDDRLCLCDWRYRQAREAVDNRLKKSLNADYIPQKTEVIEQAMRELDEYFAGTRHSFDVPLLLVGSDFQKSVWEALIQVAYGQTETYLGLSRILGNELAIRAVAAANGANAISIVVPCHRIIGSKGELIGYAGGLAAKQKLLTLENPTFGKSTSAQMALDFG
jgi:methylated-DNA-[protein]-cysteine S-methyltransferase